MDDLISRKQAIDAAMQDVSCIRTHEFNAGATRAANRIKQLPSSCQEIIRCKDCKHFEYNHFANINGLPLIVAHEICTKWSNGVKTSEYGYCFLAERKEDG